MSWPLAFSSVKLEYDPGTFIISPKVVIITSFCWESAIIVSMSLLAVTQTGQPGPEIKRTLSGITCLKANLEMATV